jgi:serine/threonine protein phosphatase PrpC
VESEPDVSKIQLAPARDHFLVLGSDGLFESLSTQQIGSIAKHALDATKDKDGMCKCHPRWIVCSEYISTLITF